MRLSLCYLNIKSCVRIKRILYLSRFTKVFYMKRFVWLIGTLLFYIESVAQVENTDSIGKSLSLDEVVVTASNIFRVDNHLLIYPSKQQREHADNGYAVLKNLMIPGLVVNSRTNAVEAMGMQASLYINGQECDSKEIRMIRPRDIEKIEYHDIPTGKYAKDKIAINFILKQYRYGGYFQIDGLQTIGYNHGDYNIAGSISKGYTIYSLFAGVDYEKINEGSNIWGIEQYYFPENNIYRETTSRKNDNGHNGYAQFRIQNQHGNRYFVGKLSLVSNSTPKANTVGTLQENEILSSFETNVEQNSISPKLDLNGNIPLSKTENFSFGLHGKYFYNTYKRCYIELPFESKNKEMEKAADFQLSAIYDWHNNTSSFSAELYHYHNIWDAQYAGSYSLWQHLWQCESLGFVTYNYSFTKKISLQSRIGLSWLQYRLHGNEKFSQLSPRVNLNIQYRLATGMLLYSFNYVNSNHGMNVINSASIDINPYMKETGNPFLKKSHDINSYIYYSSKFKKIGFSVMGQYKFNHNPVLNDFYIDDSKLIKTYTNEGDIHYISIITALTYPFNNNIVFSGDIRYNHTLIDSKQHIHNNDLTGNLSMNMYIGKFSMSPYVNFNKRVLNQTSLAIKKIPVNYGVNYSYNKGNLFAEIQIESPFSKRKEHNVFNMPLYAFEFYSVNARESQYCNIKVTYSFDFGRKTNKIKKNIDNNINSSLLRAAL